MNTESTKLNRWESLVEKWRKSGMSQSGFCKQNNLKPHQLSYWIKRLDQGHCSNEPKTTAPSGFAQVRRIPEANSSEESELIVRLPSGVELKGVRRQDIPLLSSLLEVLA